MHKLYNTKPNETKLRCSIAASMKLKPLHYNLQKTYDTFSQFCSTDEILIVNYTWAH